MTSESMVVAQSEDTSMALVLPGSWTKIPLESEGASNEEISRIIRSRFPRRDELAQLRRQTREMMRDIASGARKAQAILLALSLEIIPGVPFGSAIVASYVPTPPIEDRSIREMLTRAVPEGELVEFDHGPGMREAEHSTLPTDDGARESLDLRYLLPTPIDGAWLQLLIDVPEQVEDELVIELFDFIVNSIRWFTEEAPTTE